MKYNCPNCEVALEIRPDLAGKTIRCGSCKSAVQVPEAVEKEEGADIFISYTSSDREEARKVVDYLRSEGKTVFFDQTHLKAGLNWVTGLEEALASCRAVAVLLGPNGMGNVQQVEKDLALARHFNEPDVPVIPVLLPKNDDPPTGFLALETWIDLRSDPGDVRSLARLKAALEGIEPIGVVEDPREHVCPYRGLLPFREEDRSFFFGRDEEIEDLVDRVVAQKQPLVPIIGRSGSGKSSLVYAGLIPALRDPGQGVIWEILSLRPLKDPLCQLMGTVIPETKGDSLARRIAQINESVDLLRSGKVLLSQLVKAYLAKNEGSERVLLFVDQWEEIYSQAPGNSESDELVQFEKDRNLFIDSLLEAAANSPCTVVFTVRADFYDQILLHKDLTKHVDQRSLSLGPMSDDEIRDCIEKPAERAGYHFESGLVERIFTDASGGAGRLPLLEHLLRELWERRDGNEFTHHGYDTSGGVAGAIAKRADEEFRKLSEDPEMEKAARRVFVSLVTPGEGRDDTRAVMKLPVDGLERDVVERFSQGGVRLVTANEQSVEVSHEALIQNWETLKVWVDENRETLRVRDRIRSARRTWEEKGKPDDLLLPEGLSLEEGRTLLNSHGDVIVDTIEDYITKSIDFRTSQKAKKERIQRLVITLVSILAILAAVGAVFGFSQAKVAGESERNALHSAGLAMFSKAQVVGKIDKRFPDSLFYAARAIGFGGAPGFLDPDTGPAYKDAKVYLDSLPRYLPYWNSGTSGSAALNVDVSRNGRFVAASFADGSLRNWDLKDDTCHIIQDSFIDSIHFSPCGKWLVGVEEDSIRIWDANTKQEGAPILTEGNKINVVAFNPGDSEIAIGMENGLVLIKQLATKATVASLEGNESPVTTLAYSTLGEVCASLADGTLCLWSFDDDRKAITTILKHSKNHATALEFSPGGSHLISGASDGHIELWDVATGSVLTSRSNQAEEITALKFRPDGQAFVSASQDGTVVLWDFESFQDPLKNESSTLHGLAAESGVVSVAFCPTGNSIASAGESGNISLWNVNPDRDCGDELGQYIEKKWYDFDPETQDLRALTYTAQNSEFIDVPEGSIAEMWQSNLIDEESLLTTMLRHQNWPQAVALADTTESLAVAAREISVQRKSGIKVTGDLWAYHHLTRKIREAKLAEWVIPPESGTPKFTNQFGIDYVKIEPGSFTMGSPEGENGRHKSEQQHEVSLTSGFWAATYETTQAQWTEIMGTNPSQFPAAGAMAPVEYVNWNEAMEFCEKLTQKEKGNIPKGWEYSLPTEAEFEYLCRAGAKTAYSFGAILDSTQANIEEIHNRPVRTGSYPPNLFGIFDMHGSVRELCFDWWVNKFDSESVTDPYGPGSGVLKVCRGGGYNNTSTDCRAAFRQSLAPDSRNKYLGFRTVLVPKRPSVSKKPERKEKFAEQVWIIACQAEETRAKAEEYAKFWRSAGLPADILWIPDYSSLSGAKFWQVFVGPYPYSEREEAKAVLHQIVLKIDPEAFCIKVDQSGVRETMK